MARGWLSVSVGVWGELPALCDGMIQGIPDKARWAADIGSIRGIGA